MPNADALLRAREGTSEPAHVRAAAAHPSPFAFYDRLATGAPIFRDAAPGAPWVAARASAVLAVLAHPACFTRPPGGVIPEPIAATPIADIYGRLVRVNDGAAHDAMKAHIVAVLGDVGADGFAAAARRSAASLAEALTPEQDRRRLTQFIYELPVEIAGALVGVPAPHCPDVGRWLGAYGAATAAAATGAPALTAELLAAGSDGSARLLGLFGDLADRPAPGTLLAALLALADDRATAIANAIGLLAQAFAATSALIASSLLAMARADDVRRAVTADPQLIGALIDETLRFDAVTHSTPRFLAEDALVAGQPMRKDDMILVALAIASRDPDLNPDPTRFDLFRQNRRSLEFGAGAHACAGAKIATAIAEAGLATLLERGLCVEGLETCVSYRPSNHIRMPVFA
jgi:cytochrome P450